MAGYIDELLIKLGFDPDTSGADRYESALGKIIGTAGKVGLAVGGLAVVAGGFLAKSLIGTASQFEQFKTQLTTIEGSSDKAQQSLDWISEFAKKTPYELAEVTDAFVKLKSYGLDPIEGDFMTSIGNMASGMGKSIDQAVEAVADAVTGENERLKEFGIKSSKDSKTNTVTYTYSSNGETFTKTVKQDAKEIQGALKEIMDERFTGGMDAMSKTWAGTISNLQDTWAAFLMQIANAGVFDIMKDGLTSLADWINNNGDKIAATAKAIANAFVFVFTTIGETYSFIAEKIQWVKDNSEQIISTLQMIGVVAGIVALALGVMYAPAIAAQVAYLASMALVSGAMLMLRLASIASAIATGAAWVVAFAPFLLLAAVIAGVIVAIWYLWNNSAQVTALLKQAWASVVQFIRGMWASLTSWLSSVVASAVASIVGIWQSLKAVFASVVGAMRSAWAGMWNGAKAIAMGVINAVINAISNIINKIGSAISKVKDLAKYTPMGMAASAGSWLSNKIAGRGGSSSSSVVNNQTFNVNSPSQATSIAQGTTGGVRAGNAGVRQ